MAGSIPAMEDRSSLKVWLDGKTMSYSEAKVPIMTHSLQYGSGIFEGIRAYDTGSGTAIFRLNDHIDRLLNSAKIYSMDIGFSEKEIIDAVIALVKLNRLATCYIRPFVFYNDERIGVSTYGKRVSLFIAAMQFGAYFGEGKEKGIKCKVSSWRRINSAILPVQAKASGNYLNSILASSEARSSGFDEAILLSSQGGHIAEGPGENIFMVNDGRLITPDQSADILLGVTRDSIINMAKKLGIEVEEREVHKEELYSSDEIFFSGTAAEITPITNVDGIKVGTGKPGKITETLAKMYSDVVHGKDKDFASWLTYV